MDLAATVLHWDTRAELECPRPAPSTAARPGGRGGGEQGGGEDAMEVDGADSAAPRAARAARAAPPEAAAAAPASGRPALPPSSSCFPAWLLAGGCGNAAPPYLWSFLFNKCGIQAFL